MYIERRRDSYDIYEDDYLAEYPFEEFETIETSEGDTLFLFPCTARSVFRIFDIQPSRKEIEEVYNTSIDLVEFEWKEGFTPDDLLKATAYSPMITPNLGLVSEIEESETTAYYMALRIAVKGLGKTNLHDIAKEAERTEDSDLI